MGKVDRSLSMLRPPRRHAPCAGRRAGRFSACDRPLLVTLEQMEVAPCWPPFSFCAAHSQTTGIVTPPRARLSPVAKLDRSNRADGELPSLHHQGRRRGVCQRSRRRQDHQQNVRCGTSSAFDETTIRDPSAISTAERGDPSLLARHDDTS